MSTMIAIAAVCAALMLPTEATEAQVLEKIREDREKHARLEAAKKESDADLAAFQKRVFEATKTDNVEAAFGAIDAGNEARTQLVAANKSLSEIQAQRDEQEKAALIAQAEKDHKLTPHTKKTLEGKPLAYVKEHVELLVPIPALANSVDTTKGEDKGSDAEAKTSDGKRYEDLTPGERAKIRSESPSLYESLRADFEARGKPEKK